MTSQKKFKLKLIDDDFGIVKMDPDRPVPAWAMESPFYSVTHTESELTIVCPEKGIPAHIEYDGSWKCIRVEGVFDFEAIGVIASLSGALSQSGISIYVVTSYITDYFLIKRKHIEKAIWALEQQGHVFVKS
jgi:hypothetical protein